MALFRLYLCTEYNDRTSLPSQLIVLQVCAPTGAGKTNVAMLTMLQLINQYRDPRTGIIDKANIKAVYIAPMKALAQVRFSLFVSLSFIIV